MTDRANFAYELLLATGAAMLVHGILVLGNKRLMEAGIPLVRNQGEAGASMMEGPAPAAGEPMQVEGGASPAMDALRRGE